MTLKAPQATISTTPPSKEMEGKLITTPSPFFPDILFIYGRVEGAHHHV
jgi:hypothetical protein